MEKEIVKLQELMEQEILVEVEVVDLGFWIVTGKHRITLRR